MEEQTSAVSQSSIRVPETQSEFHLRAQQGVFRRRGVHQQSRLFVVQDAEPRPGPNSIGLS
jgi:hypothetical protein